MSSLAMALPQLQRLEYNGVVFNGSTHTEHFSVVPQLSACGRYYTHAEHTLTVTTFLDAGSDPDLSRADATAAPVLEKLTQSGGSLVLFGKGFGNIRVNVAGGKKDVRWGPLPKVDNLKTYGGRAGLTWTVTWATVTCADGVTEGAFPLEFVWDCGFRISKSGLTTRTVSGWVSVPATRKNVADRTLPVTADELRERVTPAQIPGFRRTNPGDFKLDYAKTKLTFSFEDVQFPTAVPPAGVIEAAGQMSMAQTPGKPQEWTGTLSCSYTIATGATIQAALDAYFATLEDRWLRWRAAAIGSAVFGGAGPVLHPWAFTLEDGALYDEQVVKVTCVFRVYAADLRAVLANGGLWQAVPAAHNNWAKWSASVKNHLSPRGVSNIVFDAKEDRVTDLCKPAPVHMELRGKPRPRPLEPLLLTSTVGFRRLFPPPTATGSWLEYRCAVHIEDDSGVLIGSTLPDAPLPTSGPPAGAFDVTRGRLPATGANATPYPLGAAWSPQADTPIRGTTFAQRRTSPVVYVTISGHAVRVGFPVPCPSLDSYDGRPLVPCNRAGAGLGFQQQVVGATAAGFPIHVASWRLRYAVVDENATRTGPPTVPTAPNPLVTVR